MLFELQGGMKKMPPMYPDSEDENYQRLDEQVLEYIKTHKEGVQIRTMEEKFKESRMRIGFITKKLLNEGKILRIQDDFFPNEE